MFRRMRWVVGALLPVSITASAACPTALRAMCRVGVTNRLILSAANPDAGGRLRWKREVGVGRGLLVAGKSGTVV